MPYANLPNPIVKFTFTNFCEKLESYVILKTIGDVWIITLTDLLTGESIPVYKSAKGEDYAIKIARKLIEHRETSEFNEHLAPLPPY